MYCHNRKTAFSKDETYVNSGLVIAITTVGYGEITPRSFLGRLLTIPLLVFGLLLIALPSFVLGREFSVVWERMWGKVSLEFRFFVFEVMVLGFGVDDLCRGYVSGYLLRIH